MRPWMEALFLNELDHVLLGPYLASDEPNFGEIMSEIYPMLSTGEKTMVDIALALQAASNVAKFSDVWNLDTPHRQCVIQAMRLRFLA